MLNGILQAMTNMCVPPRVLKYGVLRTESVSSQGEDEDCPNFATLLYISCSVSEHCTLVDNVQEGRREEKKGKCDNKDNQLLIGHPSKAHAQ